MNGKKIACVLLLLVVAIMAYVGQMVHQKAEIKNRAADAAENDVVAAEGDLGIAEITLGKTKADSDELIRFLEAWRPHADRMQTQIDVESAVQSSLRSSGILVVSQKFENRTEKSNVVIPKIVRAAIVVEDEYAKAMNWIGELERRLPLTRLISCHIMGGETGRLVKAEISMEIPLVNLDAEIKPDPKAKAKAAAAAKKKEKAA